MAKYRIDWIFFILTVGIFVVPLAIYLTPLDPRFIGWTLAALAAAGMSWRLIGWFDVTPTGMRMLAFILIITLCLSAWGQWMAGDRHFPLTPVSYLLISQRLMCIGAAIYWTRWTSTTTSPFVRERI
jgi:hypothetical protein